MRGAQKPSCKRGSPMIGWTGETQELATLALAKFARLSESELKMLCAATTGEGAFCGPSNRDDDPGNDPLQTVGWDGGRTIRAALLRWLCVDRTAKNLVDPRGIRVHAARIADALDLSYATVPFPLFFANCLFANAMNLRGAQLEALFFVGSRTAAVTADGLKVRGDLFFRDANVEGEVRLLGAAVGGDLECQNATFKNAGDVTLNANSIKVTGSVSLGDSCSVEGEVNLRGAEIGGQLNCGGGQFAAESLVDVQQASVAGAFLWQNVKWNLESERQAKPGSPVRPLPSAWLNLTHTTVGPLADDKESWPSTGRLLLDGFVYARIAAGPLDANSRLEWLRRQEDGFFPQPYLQLAKVLREAGDDSGARRVLIAMENSRVKDPKRGWWSKDPNLSWWSWIWAWALRLTINHGYQPFRAGWWVALFVLTGFLLFSWGHDAGVLTGDQRQRRRFCHAS